MTAAAIAQPTGEWLSWSSMHKVVVTIRLPAALLEALREHSGHAIGEFVAGALRLHNPQTIEVPKVSDHNRGSTSITLDGNVVTALDKTAAARRVSRNALLTAVLYATLGEHDVDLVEGLLRSALGVELSEARKAMGFAMPTLAGLIGITADEADRIEAGAASPTIDTVWRWCRACERIPSDVLLEVEKRANIRNWD
jgi:hypothetical protein